jgi:radical S-adenosyl methionine domain-containing protein 2
LEYHYRENTEELLDKELSFSVVSYAISNKQKLLRVRYALSANQMYSKPLFHILVLDEYLTAITDWQNPNKMKNILIPIENANGIQEKSIVFHGFNDYQVKYRMDSQLETKLKKQDFFALKKIINDAVILLTYIPTINYHLIKPCNMKCRHCFSDFDEIKIGKLPFEEAKKIIKEVAKIKSFKKLNFSGGEPTLFTKIEQLIDFAKEQGLKTSMVTNGYNLIKNPDNILGKLKGCLDLLTLSIDSFDCELNIKIGRYVGKGQKTISYDDFLQLTQKCSEYDIKIKVNTVVTKLNCNEILADKIVTFRPVRWKILRMLPVKSQNDEAKEYFPTEEEYQIFVENNKKIAENAGIKVVSEDNEDMTGSYLMISPDGKFFHNIESCHKYSEPILEVGMEKALQQTPLCREKFYKRGGDYSCE